ncbi:hypothetical protein VT98_12662 [Candidatus Electrothrix communis]|uniref:Uncharacterized protein n=1 Tax=Candidatus Electrothrix communis TaxID=1859133 RepID=A0A444J0D1_9BACT|nr:hypothetical protein [Desulfobulbus sp. US4]RWX46627.1 hypothetical protein VT98_12662 [Candidatus Electrothrix communis]WLE96773.1 MAG: hypothetical protein QTN59_19095 [Candidatus Electrothrix communis]
MKTLLFLVLFIFFVPLLIGRLANLSCKSKNDLAPLATIAGLLILFSLYLVFIDDNKKKPKGKQTQQPSSSSAQLAQPSNCNVTCIHNDYSIYEEERRERHMRANATEACAPPAIEHQRYEDPYGSY